MNITDDNVSWIDDVLPGWEGHEPDFDEIDMGDFNPGGCAYCPSTEAREFPEPFGNQPCCETCFARLIGDESDNPEPFRCGTASPTSSPTEKETPQ